MNNWTWQEPQPGVRHTPHSLRQQEKGIPCPCWECRAAREAAIRRKRIAATAAQR